MISFLGCAFFCTIIMLIEVNMVCWISKNCFLLFVLPMVILQNATWLPRFESPNPINSGVTGTGLPCPLIRYTKIWHTLVTARLYTLQIGLVQVWRNIRRITSCNINERQPAFYWKMEAETPSLYLGDIERKTHFQSTILEELKARAWGLTAGFQTIGQRQTSKPTAD